MSWRGGSTHRLIRVLAFVVTVGSVLLAAVPALAGILDTSWTAPTTSADGSPLTDLASYRVYYGLSTPPSCPGTSYLQFASSTPSPAPGQTVTARLTGLSTGSLYYVAVTAVDTNGNESACITPLSAVARIDFSVSPTATVNFGSVAIGGLADQTFTVQNTGGGTVSGTASVPAPFSVVSGGSFNLVGVGSEPHARRDRPRRVERASRRGDACCAVGQHRDRDPHLQLERRGARHAVPALGRRQLRRAPPDDLHRGAGGLCDRDRHVLDGLQRDAEPRHGSVVGRDV